MRSLLYLYRFGFDVVPWAEDKQQAADPLPCVPTDRHDKNDLNDALLILMVTPAEKHTTPEATEMNEMSWMRHSTWLDLDAQNICNRDCIESSYRSFDRRFFLLASRRPTLSPFASTAGTPDSDYTTDLDILPVCISPIRGAIQKATRWLLLCLLHA